MGTRAPAARATRPRRGATRGRGAGRGRGGCSRGCRARGRARARLRASTGAPRPGCGSIGRRCRQPRPRRRAPGDNVTCSRVTSVAPVMHVQHTRAGHGTTVTVSARSCGDGRVDVASSSPRLSRCGCRAANCRPPVGEEEACLERGCALASRSRRDASPCLSDCGGARAVAYHRPRRATVGRGRLTLSRAATSCARAGCGRTRLRLWGIEHTFGPWLKMRRSEPPDRLRDGGTSVCPSARVWREPGHRRCGVRRASSSAVRGARAPTTAAPRGGEGS
jgi:hypothetical protein